MTNECIQDVPGKFEAISPRVKLVFTEALLSLGSFLWFSTLWFLSAVVTFLKRDEVFEPPRKRYLGANKGILKGYRANFEGEHFQGIQRIGRCLIVSGGLTGSGEQCSQLIVIEMGSQQESGPWSLPEYCDGHNHADPHPKDRIIRTVNINQNKWHAGGIQALGDTVAVPIYGDGNGSEIRFYKFKSLDDFEELDSIRLIRTDIEAKAVGLCRLPNPDEGYVLMIWDDKQLMFHRSNTDDITAGFSQSFETVPVDNVEDQFQPGGGDATYQNINLLCDSEFREGVYFVATRNTSKIGAGDDYADLYKVTWENADFSTKPQIELIRQKQIYCYHDQADLAAGGGIFIDSNKQLYLYACYFWLHRNRDVFKFNEYVSRDA